MELNRYASDYGANVTEVSFSYLLQLVATLREYGEYLVLVGGWVPYFLLKNYMKSSTEFTHIGSVDIDLAVDPRLFADGLDRYLTIIEHIERLGYAEKRDRLDNVVPGSFVKRTPENVDMQVDFLTSFDVDVGKSKRHLNVQPDLMARRAKGCDIAFDYNWECPLEGSLPANGQIALKTKAANIVSAVVMKGYALGGRLDGKDPYDIYAMITYYKNGPESVAEEFKCCVEKPVVADSLRVIDEHFSDIKSNGPVRVGHFLHPNDVEMREKAITDAYMNVREFLSLLCK